MSCFERNNRVKTIKMNDLKHYTSEETTIPQKKDGKYRKLFKEFVENSSACGIDKVFSSKPLLIRIIWFILCVLCYGSMAYLSSMLIKEYLEIPTSTFVDVSFQRDMSFPSVTICNLNKFRECALRRNLPNVSQILHNYRQKDKNSWNGHGKMKLHLQNIFAQSGIKSDNNIDNDDVAPEEILNNMVLQASSGYSQQQLYKTGYNFKNLITDCRWMGVKCHEGYFSKYWTHIWNWKYGNCYIFNFGLDSNGSSIAPLITGKAGPSNGLTLSVFLAQKEHIPELNVEAGIKVVIVDQMQHPFPFHEGVTVSPGKSTSIALRKELIERVDPFEDNSCIRDTLRKENIYNNNRSLKYTVQSCLDTCLVGYQQEKCNCTEPKYPINGNKCSTDEQYKCVSEVNYNYKGDEYGCLKSCPQRCRSVSYRTTLSDADISTQSQEDFRTVLSSKDKFKNSVKTNADFLKNFLRVKIYFEELNLVRIHEKFTYSISNVLADIGGQLGLWVGLSVITFAELGDLLLSFIMLMFSKE